MNGHLIFCQAVTWLVGFQHPPEQLPSGDITKVCREAIVPEFPVLRPSPTTLALNKKQHTHQLNLFFFFPSGRGRCLGRTTGQIPIRSQDSQITWTAKSEWELLGAKKQKRKESTPSGRHFGAVSAATLSASQFTFFEPVPNAVWVKLGTFYKLWLGCK